MDAKSLDSLIREKAAWDLEKALAEALKAFDKFGYQGGDAEIPQLRFDDPNNKNEVTVRAVLALINRAMQTTLVSKWGDEAVAAFMKKVETLQGQLDDIRSEINNNG